MPWCPDCDEVFGHGSSCPRCDAFMRPDVETGAPTATERELLEQLRVPRRIERAFSRFETPVQPPRSATVITVLLIFLGGLVVGRMMSMPAPEPVSTLPAEPLEVGVDFQMVYPVALRTDGRADIGLVYRSAATGGVTLGPRIGFPNGIGPATVLDSSLELLSLGGATALQIDRGGGFVWASSAPGATTGWLPATSAAWANPTQLIVVSGPGEVHRVTPGELGSKPVEGPWVAVHQTASSAALEASVEGARYLAPVSETDRRLRLEPDDRVLAVDSTVRHAVVLSASDAYLVSGSGRVRIGPAVSAAAFSGDGSRIAMLDEDADLIVTDANGEVVSRTRSAADGTCPPTVAWDRASKVVVTMDSVGTVRVTVPGTGVSDSTPSGALGCALGINWAA